MSTEEKIEAAEVKVKPWWQSTSTWVSAATIIAVIYESGLIPADNPAYKILGLVVAACVALGLVAKRGLVEANVIKANAITKGIALGAKPTDPQ